MDVQESAALEMPRVLPRVVPVSVEASLSEMRLPLALQAQGIVKQKVLVWLIVF